MKEFKVNEYITLKLEEGKTNIYVNGERFDQCKFLMLDIPLIKVEKFDEIESIDDAADILGWYDGGQEGVEHEIDPETEFWGHCSNLQAWVENEYDTRLIHSNLAFPLLRELTEAGDIIAKKVLKEEIATRLTSNNTNVITYLFEEDYFNYLNSEEFESILRSIKQRIIDYAKKGELKKFLNFSPKSIRAMLFQNNEYEELTKKYIGYESLLQKYRLLYPNDHYFWPLRDLLREEDVLHIINLKDMRSFVPLLGTGVIFNIKNKRFDKMLLDPETKFLNSLVLAISNYEDELDKYITEDYDCLEDLHHFIFGPELVKFRESVISVLHDTRIINYSFLLGGLICSVDYKNLLRAFEKPIVFRRFLNGLHEIWKRIGERAINYYSPYYEDIGYHLKDSLISLIIELVKENDWTFLTMLENLKWYRFFTPEKLNEILSIIDEKYRVGHDSIRSRINSTVSNIQYIISLIE